MSDEEKLAMVAGRCFRVREVTERTGIPRARVYELMSKGALAYVQVGRTRLVPEAALTRMLADRLVVGEGGGQ